MRRLGAVVILFSGLLALISVPQLLVWVAPAAFEADSMALSRPWAVTLSLLPALCAVGIAVILIGGHNVFASRLFEDEPATLNTDALSLVRAGVVLVGFVLVVIGIPSLLLAALKDVSWILSSRVQMGENSGGREAYFWFVNLGGSVLPLIHIGMGALLVRRSSYVANVLLAERSSRVEPAPSLPLCSECGTAYDPADYADPAGDNRCARCHSPLSIG